jgi:hypothetical protein
MMLTERGTHLSLNFEFLFGSDTCGLLGAMRLKTGLNFCNIRLETLCNR